LPARLRRQRRVIHIEFIGLVSSDNVIALCNDGSIWRWRSFERAWEPMPGPPGAGSAA
jgi:hypothetical protein